jgi:hypothetical protein
VYHEDRLKVRNRCMTVTGTVAYVAHEDDGDAGHGGNGLRWRAQLERRDQQLWVRNDSPFQRAAGLDHYSDRRGCLVLDHGRVEIALTAGRSKPRRSNDGFPSQVLQSRFVI